MSVPSLLHKTGQKILVTGIQWLGCFTRQCTVSEKFHMSMYSIREDSVLTLGRADPRRFLHHFISVSEPSRSGHLLQCFLTDLIFHILPFRHCKNPVISPYHELSHMASQCSFWSFVGIGVCNDGCCGDHDRRKSGSHYWCTQRYLRRIISKLSAVFCLYFNAGQRVSISGFYFNVFL